MPTTLETETKVFCSGPDDKSETGHCMRSIGKRGIHRVDGNLHFCSNVCEANYDKLAQEMVDHSQQTVAHVRDDMNEE